MLRGLSFPCMRDYLLLTATAPVLSCTLGGLFYAVQP